MIIPLIRRIGITILGIYLIFLSYQTHLKPWLNIITILLFGTYGMWETLHEEKTWILERKLRLKEEKLEWEKKKIMYNVIDKL